MADYPPCPKSVEQAIAWLADPARGNGWKGMCLKAARTSYGLPGGVAEADHAADQAQAAGLLNPDFHPPRGAAVFWYIGQYGHVGVADGSGKFWGTDLPKSDYIGLAPLTDPRDRWGAVWRGWSPLLNGHLIDLQHPDPPDQPEDDMAGFTATDERGQVWHLGGVHRRPITMDMANALSVLAAPATVPFLGGITDVALAGFKDVGGT